MIELSNKKYNCRVLWGKKNVLLLQLTGGGLYSYFKSNMTKPLEKNAL